jgi:hypothetical protein
VVENSSPSADQLENVLRDLANAFYLTLRLIYRRSVETFA